MSTQQSERTHEHHHLDRNALGLFGVLFAIVAGAAPLYAMLFNVPLTIQGSGFGGPAAFVIATIVLVVFSVGYIEMARRVPATGGFYTFVSRGFGPVTGMGTAILIAGCYMVFTAAIIGPTAYFAHGNFESWFGVDVPVSVIMFVTLGISSLLAWFKIGITAKILGTLMCLELGALLIFAVAVLIAGGDSGITLAPLNPKNLFDNDTAIKAFGAAAVGIALFGAFWSWVGFEMAPNYAEETKNPRKVAKQAMYGSVIALGVLYTLTAFVFVVGWGPQNAANAVLGQFEGQYDSAFYPLTDRYFGGSLTTFFQILTITSGFAAQLAFYNTAARYLFSMGRERVLPESLARVHPKHRSPHIASMVVTVLVGLYILGFLLDDASPEAALLKLGTWSPLLGVMGILAVQALVSFAIIRFFWTQARDEFHPWKTLIAPVIGGLAQIGALVLLLENRGTLSAAGGVPFVQLMPWIVAALFALGVGLALYYKSKDQGRYSRIGQFMHDELPEAVSPFESGPSEEVGQAATP